MGPDTAAASAVGATGATIGETVRTVDRGVRLIDGRVASDPQTLCGTTWRKIELSAIDIVQQVHDRDTPAGACALTFRFAGGNDKLINAVSATSARPIHVDEIALRTRIEVPPQAMKQTTSHVSMWTFVRLTRQMSRAPRRHDGTDR